MQWVKSVKDEGVRPEHELSRARKRKNSLHRDGWEAVNPVEVIADMLPVARRDRKRKSGSKKIIWGSDYASYLVLIEPSEGYFRIIDTENKDGKQPFVYYDGSAFDKDADNDLYLKNALQNTRIRKCLNSTISIKGEHLSRRKNHTSAALSGGLLYAFIRIIFSK